jgi:hypothetical protein
MRGKRRLQRWHANATVRMTHPAGVSGGSGSPKERAELLGIA